MRPRSAKPCPARLLAPRARADEWACRDVLPPPPESGAYRGEEWSWRGRLWTIQFGYRQTLLRSKKGRGRQRQIEQDAKANSSFANPSISFFWAELLRLEPRAKFLRKKTEWGL